MQKDIAARAVLKQPPLRAIVPMICGRFFPEQLDCRTTRERAGSHELEQRWRVAKFIDDELEIDR